MKPRPEETSIEIAKHLSRLAALVFVGAGLTMIGCLPSAPAVDSRDNLRNGHSTSRKGLPDDLEPAIASRNWKYLVLHHTATREGDVAAIDHEHRRRTDARGRPWLGIGYHFLIGNGRGMADGLIEPTFRWREQLHGAHAGSPLHNDTGIGICLVGDFTREAPTTRQQAAVRRLVGWLAERYEIDPTNVLRHRDVAATECPGPLFPDELLEARPKEQERNP